MTAIRSLIKVRDLSCAGGSAQRNWHFGQFAEWHLRRRHVQQRGGGGLLGGEFISCARVLVPVQEPDGNNQAAYALYDKGSRCPLPI